MRSKLFPYWVFLTAVEEGSISAAARKLELSQPAASTLIRRLESQLGVPLLQRRSRGVTVTGAGRQILEQVRKVFLEVETLEGMFGHQSSLEGRVKLSAAHTPGVYWLPLRLAEFRRLHPKVELELRLASSAQLTQEVRDGTCNQAIVGPGGDCQELWTVPLCQDRLVMVGAPRLIEEWRQGRETPPVYWREAGSSTRKVAQERFPLSFLAGRVELPSNEAVKEAVLSELGFAVLSSWSVRRELEAGFLKLLPGVEVEVRRDFHAIRRPDHPFLKTDLALWIHLTSRTTAKP